MNDHVSCGKPNGFLPNGLLSSGESYVSRVLDQDRWSRAEERIADLISCIQPNQPSQDKRNSIVRYVQHRIMKCFSCQVFTVGSVPLKTYLPDGDIDLTAFATEKNMKDTWAIEVRDMLESEEKNKDAEFHVKEVQYIQAEVKIVKCIVENIVVDISFDQIGGLCTLCFLEEADYLISQNHLFKRSILLIKAWCYYESRILGAHHGLISTYGLETMILYIFLVFNNSFAGPLEVLYRFLEFFSKFDWEKFCVSLRGPVPISSLPDIKADPPRKDSEELLLGHFLDACGSVYANFPGGQKNEEHPFISKYLNVIDPLRRNNNLGRSVGKGNFFRIRAAFAFGAQQLASLLDCPKGNLISELDHFFTNTWSRHGKCQFSGGSSPDLYVIRPVDWNNLGNSPGLNNFTSATKGKNNCRNHVSKVDKTLASCAPKVVFSQHGNLATFSHPQSEKTHGNPRINHLWNEVDTAYPFSRTYSSEILWRGRGRHIGESVTWENYNASVRLNSNRDKEWVPKISEKHSKKMPMPELLSFASPNLQRNSAALNVPKVCSFPVHQCPPNLGLDSHQEKTNEWGFKGEMDSRKGFDSDDSGNIIENGVLILETDGSKFVSTSQSRSSRTKSSFKSNLAGRESKCMPFTIYLSAAPYVHQSQSCQVPTYFVEPSKQQEFDVMKSNFATHWKNLQHARLYQTLWNHESLLFPSILEVLPVYLQKHFSPRDDPEEHGNANLLTQTMSNGGRLLPDVPLPPAYERHPRVSKHGRNEVLRYPAWTEISAHNPKMTSFKDQRCLYTKKYTWNYNVAKGGNWSMNPNPQFAEQNDGTMKNSRSGKGLFYSQNAQFGHSKISHNSDYLAHEMYERLVMNHNKVSPSGSNATSVVFGSLRPVPFSHTKQVSSVFGEGSSRSINA